MQHLQPTYLLNSTATEYTFEYATQQNGTSFELWPQTPLDILTVDSLAVGAAASWSLLTERAGQDGWWPTLYLETIQISDSTMSWNTSQNPLEDALGLASGIALGGFWADPYLTTYPQGLFVNGKGTITGYRVGSGLRWALFYILPELWAITVLSFRWIMLARQAQKPALPGRYTTILSDDAGEMDRTSHAG